MDRIKEHYANKYFGLPIGQIKLFNELTEAQKARVGWWFNLVNPASYVYAVKRDGNLVERREKRDMLMEAQYQGAGA
jgi:hypothetical protein